MTLAVILCESRMSDKPRSLMRRGRGSRPALFPLAAGGTLAVAGLVYWFISRQSQTRIDDRTRQRLMPFDASMR
jgi:hypothetical protein